MDIKKAIEGLNNLYFAAKPKDYEDVIETDSSYDSVLDVLQTLLQLEKTIGCSVEEVFHLLDKEIIVNDNIGCVKDIRKDGEVYCIHYFDYTSKCDEIEPLSNLRRTFFVIEE